MKLFSILFVAILAITASARPRFGSECGLTDNKDDSWRETKSLNITQWSDERVQALPTLTKQQIIIAAKHLEPSVTIKNTLQAVNALRNHSEAGDMLVVYYDVNNLSVTEVMHYPGGNPVGVIFTTGTKSVLAYDGDDDISCR